MTIISIVFNAAAAARHGMPVDLIGKPGCDGIDDMYCAGIMSEVISVNGYSTVDFMKSEMIELGEKLQALVRAGDSILSDFGILIDNE